MTDAQCVYRTYIICSFSFQCIPSLHLPLSQVVAHSIICFALVQYCQHNTAENENDTITFGVTKINSSESEKCMEILLVHCAFQLNITVKPNLFAINVSAHSNNKTDGKTFPSTICRAQTIRHFEWLPITFIIVYFLF